ncbi:hypothetical protein [Parasphingorhabdus sp.]|uniref:hypothetical protein n=1 Tax=Parasphingorhabdus sp. TaxID=2709688 RepID=UPI003A924FC1
MRLSQFSLVDRMFILFIGLVIILSFPATLFRLAGIEFVADYYFDTVFLIFTGLALANFLLALNVRVPEPVFVISLVGFLVFIFAIGVVRNTEDPIGGLRYFVLPLIAYLLLIGRSYLLFFITSERFWKLVMIMHILGLSVYYSGILGPMYPGIGETSIAYAAIFMFANGHPLLLLAALVMIFLEGKRSVLFAMLITLAFIRLIKFSAGGRLLYSAIAGLLALIVLGVFLYVIADGAGSSTTVARINYINPFSDQFDLYLGSSGRFGELESFWQGKTVMEILTGSGSGFKYEWDLGFASSQSGEVKGYFHMSIANYIAVGGLVGFAVFIYLAAFPFKASQLKLPSKQRMTLFGFGFYSIVQSFFGFTLAVDTVALIFIIGPAALLSLHTSRSRNSSTPVQPQRSTA